MTLAEMRVWFLGLSMSPNEAIYLLINPNDYRREEILATLILTVWPARQHFSQNRFCGFRSGEFHGILARANNNTQAVVGPFSVADRRLPPQPFPIDVAIFDGVLL